MAIENSRLEDELRKLVERAFDSKAEAYSPLELARYFKRTGILPTLVHQRQHHVITGRKGTGKTAILRYLSLPVQVHCMGDGNVEYTGFYLTFGANLAPPLPSDVVDDEVSAELFGQWFMLYSCRAVLDAIIMAIAEGYGEITPENVRSLISEVWSGFLGLPAKPLVSLQDTLFALNEPFQALRRVLSHPPTGALPFAATTMREQLKWEGRTVGPSDYPEMIAAVRRAMPPLAGKDIFLLMDEYDNLSAAQQRVINTAIMGSTHDYYAKIGVLSHEGIKDRRTRTGLALRDDQLKPIDIERFGTYDEYEKFVFETVDARIGEIQRRVSQSYGIGQLFSSARELLPCKSPKDQLAEQRITLRRIGESRQPGLFDLVSSDQQDSPGLARHHVETEADAWWTLLKYGGSVTYTGLNTICVLSSGLIRSAIELVYAILKEALATHWDIVQSAGCIPYDVQDGAIRQEANSWLKTKIAANVVGRTYDDKPLYELAETLIENLLREFRRSFMSELAQPTINCFSIRDISDTEAEGIKALSEGIMAGILTETPAGENAEDDERVFALHRIYSVCQDLPPVVSGCLRLSWDDFDSYCRPPRGHARTRQLALGGRYFLGIGFRADWENEVRKALRTMSIAGWEYSDGEGAHKDSTLVVSTVENRLDAAALSLFDITTLNPNVFFEYGLASAKRKAARLLRNQAASSSDSKDLPTIVRGINYAAYRFSTRSTQEECESLTQAVNSCIEWYEKRKARKTRRCAVDAKCRFSPSVVTGQVYIAAPDDSLSCRCLSDLHRLIREELRLQVYPSESFSTRLSACRFCEATARSEYCIVDTTGSDPEYCGILGLAYGYRRKVLNIYQRGSGGLITNYSGHVATEYTQKEDLIHVVRSFLQESDA